MAEQFCPQCGERAHRSRSHSFGERIVKLFSTYRTYRCHECGWRGWLRRNGGGSKDKARGPKAKRIVGAIVTLLATVLLALYLVHRFSEM